MTPAERLKPGDGVYLRLLGPPGIVQGGHERLFPAERPYQLLAFLAQQGDWVPRAQVAALFWPEHAAEAARRNVRKVLYRARSLPGLWPVEEQAGRLRWPVPTDVQAFERAAADDPEGALAWWRGEPWLGLDTEAGEFAEWIGYERQRLRTRWRELHLALATTSVDAGHAAAHARVLLDHDPLDEQALQALMRAQAGAGEADAAHRSFRDFSAALARAHALEPGAHTRALATGADAEGDVFIGREAEIRELLRLTVQAGCSWITVLGPGGIGKSRLARQTQAEIGRRTGLRVVDATFDDVTDAAQFARRLAAALGVPGDAAALPWATVVDALKQQPALLVLDNLDHLAAAARVLGTALRACPAVRVVASSRVRLGVAGEWPLPLGGLPYPERDDIDRAEAFDAVRLFVQRAQAQDPAFRLDPQRDDVVALCSWLEGLPLALELAACWTRQFSVREVLADMRAGSGDMLQTAAGDAPARLQSMAATFERSWRLLPDAERQGLMRLAVFAGSFSRDAARQVTGAPLPVLAALADKSLLRLEGAGAARGARFSLHPLLQQFCATRLAADGGQQGQAIDLHARHYLRLLARFPRNRWPAQQAHFAEVDADLANLRLAWAHGVQNGWRDALAAAMVGMSSYFHARGGADEGVAWLESAAALLSAPPALLAEHQNCLALLEFTRSHYPQAATAARTALRCARRLRDSRQILAGLFMLGQAASSMADLPTAERCFTDALAMARAAGNGNMVAGCLATLAGIATDSGQLDQAVALFEQSLAQQQRNGVVHIDTVTSLGNAHRLAGRLPQARSALLRARAMLDGRPRTDIAHLCLSEAQLALSLGQFEEADRLAQAAQTAVAEGGEPAVLATADVLRAGAAAQLGDKANARRLLQHGVAAAHERRMKSLVLEALTVEADLLLAEQRLHEAVAMLHFLTAQPGLNHACRLRALALQAELGDRLSSEALAAARLEAPATLDDAIERLQSQPASMSTTWR